jgi:hypothetical protein
VALDTAGTIHTEERKLIAHIDNDGRALVEKRKRGTVIDGLLGFTDDGYVIHIPTGFFINAPRGADGEYREDCLNDRKYVLWMLDQDPAGWEASRNYRPGERLTQALKDRLVKTRQSYPGD